MNPSEFAKKFLEVYEAAQNYFKHPICADNRCRYRFHGIISMTSDGIVVKVGHYEINRYHDDGEVSEEVTDLKTLSFEILGIKF